MKKRVMTGVVLIAVLAIFIVLRQFVSEYFFDALILIASAYAAFEISVCVQRKTDKPRKNLLYAPPIFALLTYSLFLALSLHGAVEYFLAYELIIVAAALAFTIFVSYRAEQNIARNVFAMLYPTVLFMFFYLVNHFAAWNTSELSAGIGLFGIVLTFAVAAFTDTFAMFCGMIIKGPKLCPKISPKKTISGAVGGVVFGTLAAVSTFLIFNQIAEFNDIFTLFKIKAWMFVIIGIVLSVLNQVGDIYESMFKRKLEVKDTGKILPGHGGIMDRMDGMVFVSLGVFVSLLLMFL